MSDDFSDLRDDVTDIKVIPSLSDRSDRFQGWPSLSIELELAPWYWRLGWYSCAVDGHFLILYVGPLRVHVWA